MNQHAANPECSSPSWPQATLLAGTAVTSFHAAYALPPLSICIVLFLFCLYSLRRLDSARKAFYVGLAIGFGIYAPQLGFFWTIFGAAAIALWLVLAFWIGVVLLLVQQCAARCSLLTAALLFPVIWTGTEYFRSELYALRFSCLNIGYAFTGLSGLHIVAILGVYGIGFILALAVGIVSLPKRRLVASLGAALVVGIALILNASLRSTTREPLPVPPLAVAGIQLEFPGPTELKSALDKLVRSHPRTDVIVLSEYTLDGSVPDWLLSWCRIHEKYLIVGGKHPLADSQFSNTAFVVGPSGDVVFEQVKAVPIQFFKDGLPAPKQELWNSPWGKIGLCVCYDLSYVRVTDALVRQGAEALIVPTMDVIEWGNHQHALHARIAPIRAAEYGIPIFRLTSSGISQAVDHKGKVESSVGFPGQGEAMCAEIDLSRQSHLPLDRVLAPLCLIGTIAVMIQLGYFRLRQARALQTRSTNSANPSPEFKPHT